MNGWIFCYRISRYLFCALLLFSLTVHLEILNVVWETLRYGVDESTSYHCYKFFCTISDHKKHFLNYWGIPYLLVLITFSTKKKFWGIDRIFYKVSFKKREWITITVILVENYNLYFDELIKEQSWDFQYLISWWTQLILLKTSSHFLNVYNFIACSYYNVASFLQCVWCAVY